MGSGYRNTRSHAKDNILEDGAVLPASKQALSIQRTQLRMPKPHRRQVRCGAAGTGCHFNADHAILAGIALGPIYAKFVKGFQIMFVDSGDWGTVFGSFDEGAKRIQ